MLPRLHHEVDPPDPGFLCMVKSTLYVGSVDTITAIQGSRRFHTVAKLTTSAPSPMAIRKASNMITIIPMRKMHASRIFLLKVICSPLNIHNRSIMTAASQLNAFNARRGHTYWPGRRQYSARYKSQRNCLQSQTLVVTDNILHNPSAH